MPSNAKKVKQFWQEMAGEFKQSQLATAPDSYYRSLEIDRIMSYLSDNKSVLDIGCGNGYSTFWFAKKFPKSKFLGVDYSEEMVSHANKALKKQSARVKKNVKFEVDNVLDLSSIGKKFDYIVSERCLINLLNWKEQQRALLEMKKLLKKNGKIILCENTQEGLTRLNDLRKLFNLLPIKVRWHNYYMPEKKMLSFAEKNFKIKDVNNIGSLYYIISRVVYAKICDEQKQEPDYLDIHNKIASQLPSVGNFSPNFIFLLEKK